MPFVKLEVPDELVGGADPVPPRFDIFEGLPDLGHEGFLFGFEKLFVPLLVDDNTDGLVPLDDVDGRAFRK
ncbi:MAG: hypothetical protein AB1405_15015 [Bdellovibrionota bacterium]